jgi:epoxide hydrolase-like predicted phosphatase
MIEPTGATPLTASRRPRAVLFDLGGVVLGSPLHAIADYERELGVSAGAFNRMVHGNGPAGAWHRLERGELPLGERFFAALDAELAAAELPLRAQELMSRVGAIGRPREEMLLAIDRLRAASFLVAALTNNWSREGQDAGEFPHPELHGRFHHVVESRVVGLRKPDPEIYRLACRVVGVEPPEVVFLDDIGSNLKSARALGMTTIKVDDPHQALRELELVVGIPLL